MSFGLAIYLTYSLLPAVSGEGYCQAEVALACLWTLSRYKFMTHCNTNMCSVFIPQKH